MTSKPSVTLVSILSEKLNLNGDQANLFVLQKRLTWLGFRSKIESVGSAAELAAANADFVLLGHGSLAAWKACEQQWPTLAQDFASATSNVPGLAVGSGATKVSLAIGHKLKQLSQPVSEFAVESIDNLDLLGYKYADVEPAVSQKNGEALLTWLHGPLLAKNPQLADRFIASILKAKGILIDSFENENTRRVDELVAGVWQLEKPQD